MGRKKIINKKKTEGGQKIKKEIIQRANGNVVEEKERAGVRFQTLKGMKDILSQDEKYWRAVEEKAEHLSRFYGFGRLITPVMEPSELFIKGTGEHTDIVSKEMYSFTDQGGDKITLRPEFTPAVVRAYLEHGMINLPQPVKLYSIGPLFRHERPQAGRYRQFHQWNVEAIGSAHPVIDAQLIILVYELLFELGLKVEIRVNSIGCSLCRAEILRTLVNYYRGKKNSLCEDCKNRLVENPFRLLDCKEERCQELKIDAPQIVDWICQECKTHFTKVLEYLDEVQVPYQLDPYLVRGLDYYTRTVFEAFPKEIKEGERLVALGGGGRYDGLIELLGGRSTPACGFGLGVERVVHLLKSVENGVEKKENAPQVFLAQLGDGARRRSLSLFEEFRREGILLYESFSRDGLKSQLELANKLGVKYVLILGQKEVLDGTIIIRDMDGGIQEIVSLDRVVREVRRKLEVG